MIFTRMFRWLSKTSWIVLVYAVAVIIQAVISAVNDKPEIALWQGVVAFWAAVGWFTEWRAFDRGYIRGQLDQANRMKDRKPSRSEVHYTGSPMSVEDFERHVRNSTRNRTSNEGL